MDFDRWTPVRDHSWPTYIDWVTVVADGDIGKSKVLKGNIGDLKLDLAEVLEAIAEERKRTLADTAKFEAYM